MNEEIQIVIDELKNLELAESEPYFWIIHRSLWKRRAKYKTLFAKIDDLEESFINLLIQYVGKINSVENYQALTVDTDEDSFLFARSEETDFQEILENINKGADNETVKKIEDLHTAWGYAIEFKINNDKIIAFAKINEGWNIKSKLSFLNAVFKEGKFVNIVDGNIFPLRKGFDFISYRNNVFIHNKENYEKALNIREGLVLKRDDIITELKKNNILKDGSLFKKLIGDNKKHLRKLAMAQDYGYYKDKSFLANLEKVAKDNNWGIERIEGKFDVNEDNLDLFLTLINNGRLRSPINEELFDTDVKKKVEKKSA